MYVKKRGGGLGRAASGFSSFYSQPIRTQSPTPPMVPGPTISTQPIVSTRPIVADWETPVVVKPLTYDYWDSVLPSQPTVHKSDVAQPVVVTTVPTVTGAAVPTTVQGWADLLDAQSAAADAQITAAGPAVVAPASADVVGLSMDSPLIKWLFIGLAVYVGYQALQSLGLFGGRRSVRRKRGR